MLSTDARMDSLIRGLVPSRVYLVSMDLLSWLSHFFIRMMTHLYPPYEHVRETRTARIYYALVSTDEKWRTGVLAVQLR